MKQSRGVLSENTTATVRDSALIRKNERAYRSGERREHFHGFGAAAVVIRACTKTVDGHGAIMEFNNAICLLSLPPLRSPRVLLRSPTTSSSSLSFSSSRLRCGGGTVERVHGMPGQARSLAWLAG